MKCGNCHLDHETVEQVRRCYGQANVITVDQMTEKQYHFLQKLYAERDMTPLPDTYDEAKTKLGKRDASNEIDRLIREVPKTAKQTVSASATVIPDVPAG